MEQLKEKREEKRTRKEEIRENHHHHPRARVVTVDEIVECNGAYDRGISRRMLCDAAAKIGMPAEEVNEWLNYMEEVGWEFYDGKPVHNLNFRRSLRMWHKMKPLVKLERKPLVEVAELNRREKEKEAEAKRKREAIAANPKSWILCQERCANYIPGQGCKCGVKIPPAHQERQIPPEDCPNFISNGEEAV